MDPVGFLKGTLLPSSDDEMQPRLTLESGRRAFIERWLPKHAAAFVATAVAIPAVVWVAALLLAADKPRFLASRDWLAQPLYFTAHLTVVRLFVTTYTHHFAEGLRFLPPAAALDKARPRIGGILGPQGLLVAALVATPLIGADIVELSSAEFLSSPDGQGAGHVTATDALLGVLWAFEWLLNAYVWVLLVGFAALTIQTIERHPFPAPIEIVLHERHYRPFLLMSAQGASIMVGYTAVTAAYVLLTRGIASDYIGLWTTAALLLFSFVPPWLRMKALVARRVRDETHKRSELVFAARRHVADVDDHTPAVTNEEIGARLDVVVAILELDHLDRLYRDLGKSEGQAILLRLLAPLSTVVIRLLRG
jgi:hypothetical protein